MVSSECSMKRRLRLELIKEKTKAGIHSEDNLEVVVCTRGNDEGVNDFLLM